MKTRRPTNPDAEAILGGYFPVLDHGFVSLVDYMGGDDDVERAARVSYGYGTRTQSRTRGLVRYLRRHRHTTPSEMVELKFHCAMPMFVARQWIRHRTANVNEYSGRYSLMPLLFYTPDAEHFSLQSEINNQGRGAQAAEEVRRSAVERWDALRRDSGALYESLLEQDVARELARIDLPLSTYTQWYWKIDLHNLLHFLTLRVDSHAQYEIRVYAEIMAAMVRRVAPLSYEAWVDYDLAGRPLSRGERRALSRLLTSDGSGGLAPTGFGLAEQDLAECGLSGREVREFVAKMAAPEVPDFDLDLSTMRTAEDMAALIEEAVPERSKGD